MKNQSSSEGSIRVHPQLSLQDLTPGWKASCPMTFLSRRDLILAILASCALTQACVSTRTYVDPTYARATYQDLPRLAQPFHWRIVAESQRSGQEFSSLDNSVQKTVERVVRLSGIAIPAGESATSLLRVTIRSVPDSGGAVDKGFGSGLTFGIAGALVTDNYEMEAELSMDGEIVKRSEYKHALHTVVGNASYPLQSQPLPVEAAFSKTIEQMMLNFLKDLRISAEIDRASL